MAASTAQQRAHPSQTMAIAENFFMPQYCHLDVAPNDPSRGEFGAIVWRTCGGPAHRSLTSVAKMIGVVVAEDRDQRIQNSCLDPLSYGALSPATRNMSRRWRADRESEGVSPSAIARSNQRCATCGRWKDSSSILPSVNAATPARRSAGDSRTILSSGPRASAGCPLKRAVSASANRVSTFAARRNSI